MLTLSYLFENSEKSLNICVGILETPSKFSNSMKPYSNTNLSFYILYDSKMYEVSDFFYLKQKMFGENSPTSNLLFKLSSPNKFNSDSFFKMISLSCLFAENIPNVEEKRLKIYNNLKNEHNFVNLKADDFGYISLFCFFELDKLRYDYTKKSNMIIIKEINVKQHIIRPIMFDFTKIEFYNDLDSDIQTKVNFK